MHFYTPLGWPCPIVEDEDIPLQIDIAKTMIPTITLFQITADESPLTKIGVSSSQAPKIPSTQLTHVACSMEYKPTNDTIAIMIPVMNSLLENPRLMKYAESISQKPAITLIPLAVLV